MAGHRFLAALGIIALAGFVILRVLLSAPTLNATLLPFDSRSFHQLTDFQCSLPPSTTSFRQVDARSHPSVAIIGTAKGGTTDAFELLVQGLDFIAPDRKELGHMSDKQMNTKNQLRLRYLRKLNHPCTQGNDTAYWIFKCVESTDAYTLEASMTYLERHHVPERFKTLSPGTKIIVMLREPLERAASLFNHWNIRGEHLLDKTLEDCAQIFLNWLESHEGSQQMAPLYDAHDIASMRDALIHFMSFRHSTELHIFFGFLYAFQLSNWLVGFVEPGNLFVLDSHLYYSLDRGDALTLLSQYLFAQPPTEQQIAASYAVRIQNAKLHVGVKANGTFIEDDTARRLKQVFAPFNLKLLTLLTCMRNGGYSVAGFDASPWMYPTPLHSS